MNNTAITGGEATFTLTYMEKLATPEFKKTELVDGGIRISWYAIDDTVTSAAGYELVRVEENGARTPIDGFLSSMTAFTFTNLDPNTRHVFEVRAIHNENYVKSDPLEIIVEGGSIKLVLLSNEIHITGDIVPEDPTTERSKAVTIEWKEVPNAVGYFILYSTDKNFPKDNNTHAMEIRSGDTTAKLTGLKADTEYFVSIMAIGAGWHGNSEEVTMDFTTNKIMLIAPEITGAYENGTVHWAVSTNYEGIPALTHEILYWKEGEPESDAKSISTTGTWAGGFTFDSDTQYYFKIRALGVNEYETSAWSREFSFTPIQTDIFDPGGGGDTGWPDTGGYASVTTVRGLSAPFSAFSTNASPTGGAIDSGVPPLGSSHHYSALADSYGGASSTARFTNSGQLHAPILISVVPGSNSTINAEWTAVENASTYIILYATSSDFTDYEPKRSTPESDGDTIIGTITDLEEGKTYYVRIVAVGAEASTVSPWSNMKSATTIAESRISRTIPAKEEEDESEADAEVGMIDSEGVTASEFSTSAAAFGFGLAGLGLVRQRRK
jgi:hypothetical protein